MDMMDDKYSSYFLSYIVYNKHSKKYLAMSEENKNQFKSKKSIDDIKSLVLRPSLTSLYRVSIDTSKLGDGSKLNEEITKHVGIEKKLYEEGGLVFCVQKHPCPDQNLQTS